MKVYLVDQEELTRTIIQNMTEAGVLTPDEAPAYLEHLATLDLVSLVKHLVVSVDLRESSPKVAEQIAFYHIDTAYMSTN